MLRDRLVEKDDIIEKKSKQLGNLQAEKKRLDMELVETRDQLDTRDRRLSSVQRKVRSFVDNPDASSWGRSGVPYKISLL